MLEKFIEAIKNKNIEQIKAIIHSDQFNTEWLKNLAIESEIHQINMSAVDGNTETVASKPLIFYAIDNDLIEIAKTLIFSDSDSINQSATDNRGSGEKLSLLIYSLQHNAIKNEIVDLLLSKENIRFPFSRIDELLEYIKNNQYLDLNDISSTFIKFMIALVDKKEIISLFDNRSFDWNKLIAQDKEGNNITALQAFCRHKANLNKTLDAISSSPNADLFMQARYEGESLVDAIFQSMNCKDLFIKHFDLIKDHLNKGESGPDNMTPLLLGYEKGGGAVKNNLYYFLGLTDEDGLPVFNINIASKSGLRLIDKIEQGYYYDMDIKMLREYGSAELKNSINSGLQKIIINSKEPPDVIDGNKEKTTKIIELLYKKHPLINDQIDQEIEQFKNSKNYSEYFAQWKDQGIDNVLKVIDKLTLMTNEYDRLSESWNFKKILGTIIHVVKDDADLLFNHENTLSQLEMCSLSKLMHLLSVVQDKLIADNQNDYSKMNLKNFEHVLDSIYKAIETECPSGQGSLFFAQWLNQRLNEGNYKNPDKWSPATQKIQGIFSKTFAENFSGVDKSSYHFNDGLELKLIAELKEYLMPGSSKATNIDEQGIIYKFIELNKQGSAALINQYIGQFIDNKGLTLQNVLDLVDDIANFKVKILNNTDFYNITKENITNWYEKLNPKFNFSSIKEFFNKIREELEVNPEVESSISAIIDHTTINAVKKMFCDVSKKNGSSNAQKFLEDNIKNSAKGFSLEAEELISTILNFKFSSTDGVTTDELAALGINDGIIESIQ